MSVTDTGIRMAAETIKAGMIRLGESGLTNLGESLHRSISNLGESIEHSTRLIVNERRERDDAGREVVEALTAAITSVVETLRDKKTP